MIRNTSRLSLEWENYKTLYKITNDRKHLNVMYRHAFMVASRELYTTTAIGEVMGKDHATVVHATRQHDANYKWSEPYREAYHYACGMMQNVKEMSDMEFEHRSKYMWLEENIRLRQLVIEQKEKLDELSSRHSTAMGNDVGDQLLELNI